jgi:hypothetical protein
MQNKVEALGKYGALLSLIEIGLGSVLHGLHIPFSGIFLSLNQGYLLCRVSLITREEKWLPYAVSNVAAVLKSLSPAGQKLGPMLSLSVQGLLFNLGPFLMGVNLFGLILGMILLSIWSFIQPLVTYYLFFGEELFNAAEFLYKKSIPFHGIEGETLTHLFLGIVSLKALFATGLAILAWKGLGDKFQERLAQIGHQKESVKTGSPFLLALKDLTRPLFVISFLGTGAFLIFSQTASTWYLLRPVAIAFIFFYFSRTLTLDRWLSRLESGRFQTFAKGCKLALERLRKII